MLRQPSSAPQRHYEICRAYFLEEDTAVEIAQRFDLHPDSVRAIVRDFSNTPDMTAFFGVTRPGPTHAPTRDSFRQQVIDLRLSGLSLADIEERLSTTDQSIHPSSIYRILAEVDLAGNGTRTHSPRQDPPAKDVSAA